MNELIGTLAAIASVLVSVVFLWHFYGAALTAWFNALVQRWNYRQAETDILNRMWEAGN